VIKINAPSETGWGTDSSISQTKDFGGGQIQVTKPNANFANKANDAKSEKMFAEFAQFAPFALKKPSVSEPITSTLTATGFSTVPEGFTFQILKGCGKIVPAGTSAD
jgi:hypothetical protein